MKPYPDSNFLVRCVLEGDATESVLELLERGTADFTGRLPVTWLAELEVSNAIQRYVFESRHGATVRVTPEMAAMAHARFREQLAPGQIFELVATPAREVQRLFEEIALRHTAKFGFRTYDILHVASALALGCDMFWSFDQRAVKLARLEGLQTK